MIIAHSGGFRAPQLNNRLTLTELCAKNGPKFEKQLDYTLCLQKMSPPALERICAAVEERLARVGYTPPAASTNPITFDPPSYAICLNGLE